jgi:hypothetical protein
MQTGPIDLFQVMDALWHIKANQSNFDGFVKNPISALRVSLVIAAYEKYASFLGIRKP